MRKGLLSLIRRVLHEYGTANAYSKSNHVVFIKL